MIVVSSTRRPEGGPIGCGEQFVNVRPSALFEVQPELAQPLVIPAKAGIQNAPPLDAREPAPHRLALSFVKR
jgi:hypothetical protein